MTEELDVKKTVIKLEGVTHVYSSPSSGEKTALEAISLEVYEREFLVVLGPSGSGKTTLLRVIAGLEQPRSGRVALAGCDVTDVGRFPPERRGVGMVFQDYALFPHMTVWENIAFGVAGRRAARRARVEELLELIGLKELAHRYPHELSGGEQQRVALARALAPNPKVILLDEPFSNLDADLRRAMRSEIKEIIKGLGSTAVLVTHDQEEAFDLGDRIAVLNRGRLEQLGPPEEVYFSPATRFVAEFIGRADFLPASRCPEGLQTELGVFPFDPRENSSPNDQFWEVLIRPDRVEITPDPQGEAVIVSRRFSGPQKLYCLELPSGQRLHSLQPSTRALREGSRVRVKVALDGLIYFPKRS